MKDSFDSFKEELQIAISSSPIIFISHNDVALVEKALVASLHYWNLNESVISEFYCGIGEVDFETKKENTDSEYRDGDPLQRLIDYLEAIVYREYAAWDQEKKLVFLIRDMQSYFGSSSIDGVSQFEPDSVRLFTLLQIHADKYFREDRDNDNIYSIILLDSARDNRIPKPLEKITTSLELLPPSPNEIKAKVRLYDRCHTKEGSCSFEDEYCESLCRALQGLELQEINRILRTITCNNDGILMERSIRQALKEKRKLVKREGILEVIEANESFDDIGGLKVLKSDLRVSSIIYKNIDKAIKDGIKIPKGIMIVGVPGCGKSMMAKAISNEFDIPLVRLDMNRILGQYVGQSEQNMKKALISAEAASPCVLWIDEIEKAFSGASGNSNESKNDTVLRMMGLFLTWMQENKNPVYVVATANDVMRPELMRKGRFDEVYFVDFPEREERKLIIEKLLNKLVASLSGNIRFDVNELRDHSYANVEATKGFSGAEIQSLIEMVTQKAYVNLLLELNAKEEPILSGPLEIKLTENDFDETLKDMRDHLTSKQLIEKARKDEDVGKFVRYSQSLKNASSSIGIIGQTFK